MNRNSSPEHPHAGQPYAGRHRRVKNTHENQDVAKGREDEKVDPEDNTQEIADIQGATTDPPRE